MFKVSNSMDRERKKNWTKIMYTTTPPTTSPHLLPRNLTPDSKPIFNFSQKTILHLLTTKCSTLQQIKEVHAVILKTGHFQDHYVSGTLVKCYANPHFSNLDFAMTVFNHVPNPNVFVFNIVIKSCLDNNDPFKALDVYCSLVVGNARPNKFTYPTLLKACSNAEAVKEMVQVHAHVIKLGFSGDEHVKSAGIQMYANSGKIMEARRMLDEDGECDVICFNAMLDGYLKCGDVRSARELFDNMVDRNVGSWNVMVSGLAKYGMVEEARVLFNGMKEKDQISWSSMVDGYVKGGYHKEALEVFNVMQKEKIRPNIFVLSSVLAACANIGALDQGRWVHAFVRKNFVYVDAVLGTALLDMYAKCGRLDLAWDVFEKMKKKEVFTWNAMICGLAMHGRAEDAVGLFSKMQREKFRPNKITFVGVLNACAHAGNVDKGLRVLNSMSDVYGIEPDLEHYGCVVDILGRAGKLAEAEEFIWSMPMEPNAAVWGALLGACRIHGNAELGEKVGNILLEIDPENSGRYALLSNIYAKAKRWDDVANVRKLMKERGVKTTTGTSMIDLGGVVHEFKMGDGSHPQITEVNKMLMNMMERLEMEGYKPNTSHVLFDIGEEEKENALKYHSEKLAIAFGLINTNQRTSIRVVNSLRMCEDCHGAIKLISRVYGREIIVRDRVRYHHFKDGDCSCKDFW